MLNKLFKEPLVHFIAIGIAIFFAYYVLNPEQSQDDKQIIIDNNTIAPLISGWQRVWMREPNNKELHSLIEDYIQEEIYYREAMAMDLDKNDMIIRRRLRQKMEFLTQNINIPQPSDNELLTWLQTHQEEYRNPAKISFSHIYFNADKHGANIAEVAEQAYQSVLKQDNTVNGDPFMLPKSFKLANYEAIQRVFGENFASALFSKKNTGWHSPIPSAFGMHIVNIESIQEASDADFETLKPELAEDWKKDQQRKANQAMYESMRSRYNIVMDYDTP